MSTLSDVLTAIRDDLKDDGTTQQFTDAQIVRYMNRFRIFLAALNFRYQITAGIKSTNMTAASGTGTFTLPSDFFAEKLLNHISKSDTLRKTMLDEYIAGGYNTATSTGTCQRYMILGDTLYLFDPLPVAGTYQMWYYYLESALSASTTTASMPHGGLLDEYWREFTSKMLLNRNEYSTQYEEYLFKQIEGNILNALVGRSPQMYMIPQQDAGEDTGSDIDAFYE